VIRAVVSMLFEDVASINKAWTLLAPKPDLPHPLLWRFTTAFESDDLW